MTYLSAVQVKNLLAKKGVARGKKSNYAKLPSNGVVTTDLGDGWVWVEYSNAEQAAKEGVDSRSYNHSMGEIIHFILKDMNDFEYRQEARQGMQNVFYEHFYRKAI